MVIYKFAKKIMRHNFLFFGFGHSKLASRHGIGLTIGISVVLLLIIVVVFLSCLEMKHKPTEAIVEPNLDLGGMENVVVTNRRHLSVEHETEDFELPLMELSAVSMATDNFSDLNKLGSGGFGEVNKGRLLDGQQIAVKKLSEESRQGAEEFLNEVRLISTLQHKNLVRLLGCCVDGKEKILVYEYVENGSLASFILDKTKGSKLSWQTRIKIINGIARGVLYLHQDSRLKIVHRDLKPSNVLLDNDMNPKIADFGLARIFARDETEATTSKMAGTIAYMSPEYGQQGIISLKSDVYSFGIIVLEILSGKMSTRFCKSDEYLNLSGYVWKNWEEGKPLEAIDTEIRDFPSSSSASSPVEEQVLRCMQVGLVCVQEDPLDRPTMSAVVMMLEGENVTIPQPKKPGFYVTR